ncbi:MAG: hypothetical protein RL661_1403 [Pseudomonadota bacterium]
MLRQKATVNPGDKFGRWTVIGGEKKQSASNPKSSRQTLCLCDCGKKRWVVISAMRSGRTTSCGCRAKELHSALIKRYQALPKSFVTGSAA